MLTLLHKKSFSLFIVENGRNNYYKISILHIIVYLYTLRILEYNMAIFYFILLQYYFLFFLRNILTKHPSKTSGKELIQADFGSII